MRLSLQSTFSAHTLRSWRAGSESGYSTRMSNSSPILWKDKEGEGEEEEVEEGERSDEGEEKGQNVGLGRRDKKIRNWRRRGEGDWRKGGRGRGGRGRGVKRGERRERREGKGRRKG